MNSTNDDTLEKVTDSLTPRHKLMSILERFPVFASEHHLRNFEEEIKIFKDYLENEKAFSTEKSLHEDIRYLGNGKETEGEAAMVNLELVYDKMQRLNILRETELERLRAVHENLSAELKEAGLLNQDLVIPEIEKLRFELSSCQQDASYDNIEIERTENVLLLLENEIESIRSNLDEIQNLYEEKTNERTIILNEPKRIRDNIDDTHRDLEYLHCNLRRINETNTKTEASILKAIALIREETDRLGSLNREKEKIKLVYEEKDDSLRSLQRQLDALKLDRGKVVTSRLQLELELKHVQDSEKIARQAESLWNKQSEGLKRILERKRLVADSDTRMINQMVVKVDECDRTISLQKVCNQRVLKEVDKIKASISKKFRRLSHQSSVREDLSLQFDTALRSVEVAEIELSALTIENNKSDKLLSLLSAHMEILGRRATALIEDEDEVKEQIKIKNLILADLKCTLQDSCRRLIDMKSLQLTLLNEKDIITTARVASSERIAMCEKDLNFSNAQLEALLNDHQQKSCILLKHQDSHENSRVLRAALQTEKANVCLILREKKEESNRCLLQIKNLRDRIMNLRREIFMQQSRKRTLVAGNRLLSKKLRETMGEVLRSHQRANLQERYVKEADLTTRQRKEDMRSLSLKVLFHLSH